MPDRVHAMGSTFTRAGEVVSDSALLRLARKFCHARVRQFTLKPTVRGLNVPAMMVWVTCPVPFKVAIAGRALTESAPGFSPP